MKFTDLFQKGYYINLDRRTDRRQEFEVEMKLAGFEDGFFERFSAEDGVTATEPHVKHFYCGASYYNLFKKIYEDGPEYFLIFEDDAEFYNGGDVSGLELAERAIGELQHFDWDMIYFGGYPFDTMELVSPHLSRCDNILTTHAIGYKRSVLDVVLGHTDLTRRYIPFDDGAIDAWFSSRTFLKKYLVNPVSIIQRHSASDIDAFGHKATAHGFLERYETATKIKLY